VNGREWRGRGGDWRRRRKPRIAGMVWTLMTRKKKYLAVRYPFFGYTDVQLCELTYTKIDSSIEAPPSFMPQRHYCDITGLEVP
jgi:hypothetical protein